MRTTGAGRLSEIAHGNLEKLVEDKDCLYIYTGSVSAELVPFSAFADAGERRRFLHILEEKMHGAAAKAPV